MNSHNNFTYKMAILYESSSAIPNHENWINAIDESDYKINYDLIDLKAHDWIEKAIKDYDTFLISSPFLSFRLKNLFDERIYVLNNIIKKNIYPSLNSFFIYENKRLLNYFLRALNIPHPATYIFYDQKEAQNEIKNFKYPVVGKTIIGASGSGVTILKDFEQTKQYVTKCFTKGISYGSGPNFSYTNIFNRIKRGITTKKFLRKKISNYSSIYNERHHGFVYIQEYIPHTFEWRCVRIDNSYFAHKKIVKGQKASGTLLKEYCDPPIALLDFVKDVSTKLEIDSAAFDIFEQRDGYYLINEVQTLFGQSDTYQMKVNGVIGRYILKDNEWIFEEGDFCRNSCYNLRLKHAIRILTG